MDTSLKTFIRDNREQFDIHEPSDLWIKISSQLAAPPAVTAKKISGNLLKKGFFITAAAAAILSSYLYFSRQEKSLATGPQAEMNTVGEEQKIIPETDTTVKQTTPISSIPVQNVKTQPPAIASKETKSVFLLPENEANTTPETPESVPVAENAAAVLPVSIKTADTLSDKGDSLFNGIKRIEIDGDFFNIRVKTHAQNSVLFHKESHITARGLHSKISEYKVITEKKDSTLKIFIDCDGKKGVFIVGTLIITAKMDLVVPEGTEVLIRNVSGDVQLDGLKGKKTDITTSSGSIKTENMVSTMNLSSVSGDISSRNCTGAIKTVSSSGSQWIEGINGNVSATSVSGDLKLTTVKGELHAASSSGNHTLTAITGTIHSAVVSGDVKVTGCKGDLFIKTSSGDIIGKDNQLNSASQLESVSGDISMSFLNDIKDLSFDLQSISGNLSVNNGKEVLRDEKRLLLSQGTIRIKGVTSSGNQNFK